MLSRRNKLIKRNSKIAQIHVHNVFLDKKVRIQQEQNKKENIKIFARGGN